MSGKSKSKDKKKKRGIRGESLDFVSPLTVNQCIAHLRSGGSDLPGYELTVKARNEQLSVQLLRTERSKKAVKPKRNSFFRHKWQATTAPICLEGKLEPHPAGTKVTGQVVRELDVHRPRTARVFKGGFVLLLLLLFCMLGTSTINPYTLSFAWLLLCIVVNIAILSRFDISMRSYNRQRSALGFLLLGCVGGTATIETNTLSFVLLLLSIVMFVVMISIFDANTRSYNRQVAALLAWVTDRLDIQRQ